MYNYNFALYFTISYSHDDYGNNNNNNNNNGPPVWGLGEVLTTPPSKKNNVKKYS